MITNNQKPDYSKGLGYFQASIQLDGQNTGQATQIPDEELAAQQGITIEQLRDARAKILARVYAYILSWDSPSEIEKP